MKEYIEEFYMVNIRIHQIEDDVDTVAIYINGQR